MPEISEVKFVCVKCRAEHVDKVTTVHSDNEFTQQKNALLPQGGLVRGTNIVKKVGCKKCKAVLEIVLVRQA